MSRFIPYLSDEAIERDAAVLFAEYAQARGVVMEPPIPIEDIVEKHLKLGFEFDDTHKLFGVPRSGLGLDPDILGAIFFDDRRIVIDESLDPEENPAKEGRYRFTLAHEGGGHWRLHRHLFAKDPAQAALFGGPAASSFVCRSSEAKKREEWQADFETRDFYLACFLRCAGYELLGLRAEGRRKVFVFQDRPTRRDDVIAFYGDATTVRPLAVAAGQVREALDRLEGLVVDGGPAPMVVNRPPVA